MRTSCFACVVLLLASFTNQAQRRRSNYDLPTGAVIVETRSLASQGHPDRALILWMLKPAKNPRDTSDDIYTCPEYTRGSYYSGPTRVSLVNLKTRRVINTVKVTEDEAENADSFDIPYRIKAGYYYHVAAPPKVKEGKPTIMRLHDYNGDGKALEFALFDAMACMGLETAIIGYSERQDKVIQYAIQLAVKGDTGTEIRVSHWCDYLFSKEPTRPGSWKYEIDYRGRGGSLDKYEVQYNRQKETFVGTYVWTAAP